MEDFVNTTMKLYGKKGEKCLDHVRDYQLLKMDFAPYK
jgi:hypothetical protein